MDLAPHIAKADARLRELEAQLAAYDFKAAGNDQRRYEALSREYRRLARIRELWAESGKARQDLADLAELAAAEADPAYAATLRAEAAGLETRLPKVEQELQLLILPPRPFEDRDLIMEIRPAAGGDEAGLFAGDLFRMYSRFVETRGWKLDVLEFSGNAVGGLKEVFFSVRGDGAFRHLCYESGVHRVQRVPTTEAQGRIHTSTVTVAVLPEADEVDFAINPADLRIDTCRSSGAGGQHVNRTDSAVRVTHLPSGLAVFSQQERSQHKNRDIAMRLLRSRLLEIKQREEAAKNAAERRQQVGTGDRSERIRTYNFPQSRVTDHRFEITRYDLPEIVNGERFGELVETIMAQDLAARLAAELA